MRLRHLRVRNIRSYVTGAVEFADGTTLIAGDVGAGKTSLLYAIEMALFGTSEVDAAFLVRHGASHAEVHVAFEDAEHRYEIGRKFRRVQRKGKPTYEPETISFSVDGARTEYSATELRQRVIELLGFPDNPSPQSHSDLWRWAVYVPQERMRDILAARPQDRLETVRKALGVEQYRVAAENAQDVATDLRRSAGALRGEAERLRHFDDEYARWTAEADRHRADRVSLEAEVARLDARAAAARTEVASADAAMRALESDRREWTSLRTEAEADRRAEAEREHVRAQRAAEVARLEETVTRDRATAGELDSVRRVLEESDEEIVRLRASVEEHALALRRLAAARADLSGATTRRNDLEEELQRADRELARARSARDECEEIGPTHEPPAPTPDSLDAIDARLTSARTLEAQRLAEEARADSALHEFEDLLGAGVCPRCGQTVEPRAFEPHRAEAAATAGSAAAAHAEARRAREGIEDERRARERYERALDRWRDAEREREAARTGLVRAEAARASTAAARLEAEGRQHDAERRVAEDLAAEAAESEARRALERRSNERGRLARQAEAASEAAARVRVAENAIEVLRGEQARQDREDATIAERRAARARRAAELEGVAEALAVATTQLEDAARRAEGETRSLEEARQTLVRIDGRLDNALGRVADAERGRTERARRVAEAAGLEAKAEWLAGAFRRAVLAMEQRRLAHAQALFERSLTRFFAALVDDPSFVARTDLAFTPAVAIDGEWTPAEALSGGERTSLALAFRLALAEVVRTLGHLRLETLLLDEPTDGFSPEQVVRMGELLDALALPQVVLVSHEEALAGIADRVVRVEKVGGRSVVRTGARAASPPEDPAGPAPAPRAAPE